MNVPNIYTRRTVLKSIGAGAALVGLGLTPLRAAQAAAKPTVAHTPQPFVLPPLAYAHDALEPWIDVRTMEIHHGRHHQAYIDNANKALAGHAELQALSAEQLLADLNAVPESIRTAVRNNVGGHHNHALFWRVIGPGAGGEPSGSLAAAIRAAFGDVAAMRERFNAAAMTRFGSGWAWLSLDDGKLVVHSTPNQDSPLGEGRIPLLGLDVWEHAYYLRYQNRRADYVKGFWSVVNWTQVAANYKSALG
ncbi:MAG: superoxide dismutase [Opitutaceae bacterium]|nr:superoxide dismutase [Opitutaceae bacterium]